MINPWLDTFVLWIHILAAISWIGGMVFVAFILGPYVRRVVPPESRTSLMAAVGKRFSALGWSAIFTLVCTGIYNAVRFLGSWDALFGTTFGHLLLAKIALVGVMIGLSIAHDFFLGPRQRDLGRLAHQTQRPSFGTTLTPAIPATGRASLADQPQHLERPSVPGHSSEQAFAAQALQRLRRWTVLIAQFNLVLGVLVILLAASLQSF
jgi:putative copper resistance protein D